MWSRLPATNRRLLRLRAITGRVPSSSASKLGQRRRGRRRKRGRQMPAPLPMNDLRPPEPASAGADRPHGRLERVGAERLPAFGVGLIEHEPPPAVESLSISGTLGAVEYWPGELDVAVGVDIVVSNPARDHLLAGRTGGRDSVIYAVCNREVRAAHRKVGELRRGSGAVG